MDTQIAANGDRKTLPQFGGRAGKVIWMRLRFSVTLPDERECAMLKKQFAVEQVDFVLTDV